MTKKKILCILGHPLKDSLCGSIHADYVMKARSAGHEVKELILSELNFDPLLHHGYKVIQPLEPDLIKAQELIIEADHLVFTFPVWWGTYPALLKGFIDRAFIPGFSYRFKKDKWNWQRLLKGRSARIIITMDGPFPYFKYIVGPAAIDSLKNSILEFCGVSPVKVSVADGVKFRSADNIKKLISKIGNFGFKGV